MEGNKFWQQAKHATVQSGIRQALKREPFVAYRLRIQSQPKGIVINISHRERSKRKIGKKGKKDTSDWSE